MADAEQLTEDSVTESVDKEPCSQPKTCCCPAERVVYVADAQVVKDAIMRELMAMLQRQGLESLILRKSKLPAAALDDLMSLLNGGPVQPLSTTTAGVTAAATAAAAGRSNSNLMGFSSPSDAAHTPTMNCTTSTNGHVTTPVEEKSRARHDKPADVVNVLESLKTLNIISDSSDRGATPSSTRPHRNDLVISVTAMDVGGWREQLEKIHPHVNEGQELDVRLAHYNSPTEFYLHYDDDELSCLHATMQRTCFLMKKRNMNLSDGDFTLGALVAAKYSVDCLWYRAEITDIVSLDHASVFFLDYGNSETVDRVNMLPLDDGHRDVPIQAFSCWLHEYRLEKTTCLAPIDHYLRGILSQSSKILAKIVRRKRRGQFDSVPKFYVDLTVTRDEDDEECVQDVFKLCMSWSV